MAWTRFSDMHSGGGLKAGFDEIFIEAEESEAVDLFERIFDRDPYNVTCDCCGGDFWITAMEIEDHVTTRKGESCFFISREDIQRFIGGEKILGE